MSVKFNEAQDFASSIRTKQGSVGQPDAPDIDPHFVEDPNASKVVEFAFKRRKNCLLVGPTGCGKSSLVMQIASRLNDRVEIFSCTGETTTEELIGKPWIKEKNGQRILEVIHGAALRAYETGKALLIEEVDMGLADILASLHRLMESQSSFYTANIGEQEIIKKHKDFFMIATANTIGTGEDTFMYSGTKPLNQAFMNRFSLTVQMDYLPMDKECKVLVAKTGIDSQLARQLVETAVEVRNARTTGSDRVCSTVSTRDLLEWADVIVGLKMTPLEAAYYAFMNRASEKDRDIIKNFVEDKCS